MSASSTAGAEPQAPTAQTNLAINFTGLTHDHSSAALDGPRAADELCSAIAIMRRHPMYDCLILVKKFRKCLGGHSLEFPLDKVHDNELEPTNESPLAERQRQAREPHQQQARCNRRRLVSRFLDGDDPIFGACCEPAPASRGPFVEQLDERGQHCELVHVPINGLLDRLACYTGQGVAVDSRVYAFAMGLKTAERIMSTKSMKELQETPI